MYLIFFVHTYYTEIKINYLKKCFLLNIQSEKL